MQNYHFGSKYKNSAFFVSPEKYYVAVFFLQLLQLPVLVFYQLCSKEKTLFDFLITRTWQRKQKFCIFTQTDSFA